MRRVVLRAPETDRKIVEIPARLGDLTDWATSYATGTGDQSTTNIVEPFTSENATLDGTSELVNVTGSTVLTVTTPGYYLVIVTVSWVYSVVGAPVLTRRIGFSKNGAASFEASLLQDNDSTGTQTFDDQASFMVRLAAGDTVQPRVEELTGVAADYTSRIQIAKLAP